MSALVACAEPLPESPYCCQLALAHTGWHRAGKVRWGNGSEVGDKHTSSEASDG